MYLVKCGCGSFYKLDEKSLKDVNLNRSRICPNCGADHSFEDNPTLKALSASGIEIIRIVFLNCPMSVAADFLGNSLSHSVLFRVEVCTFSVLLVLDKRGYTVGH